MAIPFFKKDFSVGVHEKVRLDKIGFLYLRVACSWYVEHDFFLPSKIFFFSTKIFFFLQKMRKQKNKKKKSRHHYERGGKEETFTKGRSFGLLVFMAIVVDNPPPIFSNEWLWILWCEDFGRIYLWSFTIILWNSFNRSCVK